MAWRVWVWQSAGLVVGAKGEVVGMSGVDPDADTVETVVGAETVEVTGPDTMPTLLRPWDVVRARGGGRPRVVGLPSFWVAVVGVVVAGVGVWLLAG